MMQRLLWKDGITLKPLVLAICIGVLAINFLVLVLSAWEGTRSMDAYILIWILMPNLVALGAPALLVGSEEESGTLAWLRTLPVGWQKIVDAKLLASLAAVIVVWIFASVILFLISLIAVSRQASSNLDQMISVPGVLHLMFFSVLLLLTGFATAYFFRSPITALIVLIPVMIFVQLVTVNMGQEIVRRNAFSDTATFQILVALGVAALAVAWLIQRWLGRRRLTAVESSRLAKWREASATAQAYRPTTRIGARPSVIAALLWQQSRQVKWPSLLLGGIMAAAIIVFYLGWNNTSNNSILQVYAALSPMVVGLGASWLGALAFYSENVRRRCAFFADRGVAPTQVWWTRLFFPGVVLTLLVVLATALAITQPISVSGNPVDPPWIIPLILIVGFAFGQLVGQWVQRPTLSFLGAPVYGLGCCLFLIFLLSEIYPTYGLSSVLMVPVLLFATWRLTARWLSGSIDVGYHCRVIAYSALAVLLPVLFVFANRMATIPSEMTAWRSQMLTLNEDGVGVVNTDPQWGLGRGSNSGFLYLSFGSRIEDQLDDPSLEEKIDLLDKELAGEDPAGYVSRDDLENILRERNDYGVLDKSLVVKAKLKSIAVLLKWATEIREDTAAGKRSLWEVRQIASAAENRAVEEIRRLTDQLGGTTELAELVGKFPSKDLRYRSRRVGLINEWRAYQTRPWRPKSDSDFWRPKAFLGMNMASRVSSLPFERTRSDRYVDLATRRTLEQLETGLPTKNSETYFQTRQLWEEARGPRWAHYWRQSHLAWDNSADLAISELQAMYALQP